MDNGRYRVLLENSVEQGPIPDIAFDKAGLSAGDFRDGIQNTFLAIAQVVQNQNLITVGNQLDAGMRADKAGTASNKNGLGHRSFQLKTNREQGLVDAL
jgi:hypothetical protein